MLAELATFQRDARRGRGRLVLVAGEAGIGKTSLVDAFCRRQPTGSRCLWGSCDAITPARPFGPLADIAAIVGGSLERALSASDRDGVLSAFLTLLRDPRRATVVVLDDLHWADDATLDLLRVVGRRLRDLPVLLIATYRDDEVDAVHPMRLALGDVPPGTLGEITVPPLSAAAVTALARGTGHDPVALHRIAAGNPFFVTEVIAAGGAELRRTIRDAVLARAARLSPTAQQALRAASILGPGCTRAILMTVAQSEPEAIDECLSRGLLRSEGDTFHFRHELAQRAIRESLAPAERVNLSGRALAALRSRAVDAELSVLATLAVDAGDVDAVLALTPQAGRRAAELGAHREAAAHFSAAVRYADLMDDRARATLLEAHARECRITDRIEAAIASQRGAIAAWRRLGDSRRQGDSLQALSLMLWFSGDGEGALRVAREAVELLEGVEPHGSELARAYAGLAQRLANSGRDDATALAIATRALRLAERIGEEQVAVHALTTIGLTELWLGNDAGWTNLAASANRAKAAGLAEDAARALINIVETARDLRRYAVADDYRDEAAAYIEEHDLDLYRRRLESGLAEMELERGRWHEAAELATGVADERATAPLVRAKALVVIGRLRARRGEGDPWAVLDEALSLVGTGGDAQDLCPVYAARAEAAWLAADVERAAEEARLGLGAAATLGTGAWWLAEAGFWALRVGAIDRMPESVAEPYALHADGRHRDAAAAWSAIGCPYHEAQALADAGDEPALREALEILHGLGARPLARRVRERLHAIGVASIPRGPRQNTRRNPAGLTDRQLEVLRLLARGASNSEIADELVVSPKTVDHHVSAIFAKLGVHDRGAAARIGLKDGVVQLET